MADSETAPGPRRSKRERKLATHFIAAEGSNKRKRTESETEDDDIDIPEPDDDNASGNEGDGEDYSAPQPKLPATTSTKAKGKSRPRAAKARVPPAPKKPRITKVPGPKKVTTRAPRKAKDGVDGDRATKSVKESKIADDNDLFNAIMNPGAALQATVEDFLESLARSSGAAQAELINLVLRACGCNDSVDADSVVDYDGVVDALDDFTEGLKRDDSPIYPLTSRLPIFKKFRKSLSEFIERLIDSAADLGSLYTTDLMTTLQTWVIAMSSSQIRSFRHTATVIALEVETALCDVAAAVEKEAEVLGRQREGEKKRKASNKGGRVREKELEGKAAEVRDRRTNLAEFIKEFIDGVFVHRYRDLDPTIRAECVRSLGLWFKKYPGHFLNGSYLRYVGWVLSDATTTVRLEAVKALSGVYAQADYLGSFNLFTERFKPRLLEIAEQDTELSVRVAVIQILESIDGHSLLEDEERERLCLLIFDEEAKVRKAVSPFVKGAWQDSVDESLAGKKLNAVEKSRVGIKALARLLVTWSKTLDQSADHDSEDNGSDDATVGPSRNILREARIVGLNKKDRIAYAVEALWDALEPVSDWEGLLDVLLVDHSAARDDDTQASSEIIVNGNDHDEDSVVDEAWRLHDVEEGVLLKVLVATLSYAKVEATGGKKGKEDTVANDITRALIKGLPRLFIKHQTDQIRIAEVLLLPTLLNLDLYLEMRMITAYAGLWEDVSKQFLSHSSLNVLTRAMSAIRHLMDATSLSNTNSAKILELEDELSSSLRDAVAGREEIETASFTEDEVLKLGSICMRVAVLAGTRNMTAWMEENEGGKQSSAWDIVCALVERGRLGYKEEETMVTQAIQLLTLHIMWKARALAPSAEPSADEINFRENLREQRAFLLEKMTEFAVGTQSNTIDGVKRAAFQSLMNIHILFCPSRKYAPDGTMLPTAALALSLDDEVQYRCAGFIQAEIERFSELIDDGRSETEATSDEELTSEGEASETNEEPGTSAKATKTKKPAETGDKVNPTSRTGLEQEYVFMEVISTFLRAIRAGVVHPRHSAVLLAHYGRLGQTFDLCCKIVVDVLREEGMHNDNGEVVATGVTRAIQESFDLVLDGIAKDESHTIALSKLLVSCFIIRGAQLSVVRRLDSTFVVQVQMDLLTWIGERLAVYEKNQKHKTRKATPTFFKVLLPLLTVNSDDATKIKAHMDLILAQTKLEISPTSKIWESQRAYEKRLNAILTKEKGPKVRKPRGKGKKGVNEETSDEGEVSAVERPGDDAERDPEPELAQPRPRPKPRPVRRASPRKTPGAEESETVEPDVVVTDAEPDQPSLTPKATPRRKAVYKTKSPRKPTASSPERSTDLPEPEIDWRSPETPSRKRLRSIEGEDDLPGPVIEGIDVAPENDDPENRAVSREPTPSGEIQIRRKRVRH